MVHLQVIPRIFRSKVWGHINKAWKIMVKNFYQFPPRTRIELLHSNIWWLDRIDFFKKGFFLLKGLGILLQRHKECG